MFILMKGLVELRAERDGVELFVGWVESGEFLGEKALTQSETHVRYFSARAKTDVVALELDEEGIEDIQLADPVLMNDIYRQMFELAARRLDQANYLTKALRGSDNILRFINLILFFSGCTGRFVDEGIEVELTIERFRYFIDMSQFELEEGLAALLKSKLIEDKGNGYYFIPSREALTGGVSIVRDALPDIRAI